MYHFPLISGFFCETYKMHFSVCRNKNILCKNNREDITQQNVEKKNLILKLVIGYIFTYFVY